MDKMVQEDALKLAHPGRHGEVARHVRAAPTTHGRRCSIGEWSSVMQDMREIDSFFIIFGILS